MKTIEEPIRTSDDVEFSREEIKHAIDNFNGKKAPGIDGITGWTMHQQSSGTNGYPKSIRIYTIYGIGGKISTSTYRQPENTSITTKPEETYTPHRTNQN